MRPFSFSNTGKLLLSLLLIYGEACFSTLPISDNATTRTAPTTISSTPSSTQTQLKTTTTTGPITCTVGSTPFGTFDPAPGSTILNKNIAVLTCDPGTRTASSPAVLSSICLNGVMSPTTECLPCPDATWLYDSSTNRCFKAFRQAPASTPCDINAPCVGVGLPYGVPSSVGYTLNLPILISAGTIGIKNNIGVPFDVFWVGISDVGSNQNYQLLDGTPVPLDAILPLFGPGQPNFTPIGSPLFLDIREPNGLPGGFIGFDDDACTPTHGSVCQLQL